MEEGLQQAIHVARCALVVEPHVTRLGLGVVRQLRLIVPEFEREEKIVSGFERRVFERPCFTAPRLQRTDVDELREPPVHRTP